MNTNVLSLTTWNGDNRQNSCLSHWIETSIFITLWSWVSNSKPVRLKEEGIAQQERNWVQNCVNSSNINFRWHPKLENRAVKS